MPDRTTTTFPASFSRLAALRSLVRRAAGPDGATPGRLDDFLLGVHEAATNIVRHSLGEGCGEFRASAARDRDRLVVELEHDGTPFRPGDESEPSFDGSRDGGFGLYLIRQCVDSVTYDCLGCGTSRVTLALELGRTAPRPPREP